jgi:hypothetical protein
VPHFYFTNNWVFSSVFHIHNQFFGTSGCCAYQASSFESITSLSIIVSKASSLAEMNPGQHRTSQGRAANFAILLLSLWYVSSYDIPMNQHHLQRRRKSLPATSVDTDGTNTTSTNYLVFPDTNGGLIDNARLLHLRAIVGK